MASLQETTSHLQENPYELAQDQLRKVARAFSIDDNLVNVLSKCKKAVTVAIPVTMDDGRIEVGFEVDSNVNGQTWTVRIRDNGDLVFSGSRTTHAPSGSFTVDRRVGNKAGN